MAPAKLIHDGMVLDLDGNVDRPDVADILVIDGRIAAVGPQATELAKVHSNIEKIDASGRLVIPGLVNAHYHSHDVLLRGLFEQMPLDVWVLYSSPANYPSVKRSDIRLRTVLGAADCLANGITTVQDMVTIVNADRGHVDEIVSAYDSVGIDVVLGLQISDRASVEAVPYWGEMAAATVGRLPGASDTAPLRKVVEERIEAGQSDRLRWALAPSGPQRASDDLLNWVAKLSDRHGLRVFTHLYEARSQAVLARMAYRNGSLLGHLEAFGLLNSKLTIAHGVWIEEPELERFGRAGASLAFNPISNMKLLNGFAPVRGYIRHGANIGLGCDNCSGNDAQSLFQSLKMFALYWSMQSPAGEEGAARQAFHAATLGGAKALGLEGEIGAIRPGYRANLVTLDLHSASYRPLNSALKQLVYSETGQSIDMVMVGGEVKVSKGLLVDHTKKSLADAADQARQSLREDLERVISRNKEIIPELIDAYEKANGYPLSIDRLSMRS